MFSRVTCAHPSFPSAAQPVPAALTGGAPGPPPAQPHPATPPAAGQRHLPAGRGLRQSGDAEYVVKNIESDLHQEVPVPGEEHRHQLASNPLGLALKLVVVLGFSKLQLS